VVVVAGHEDDLRTVGQRGADRAHDRLGAGERIARGPVAQLERVAEQDEPVDARQPGGQQLERRGPSEHVGAAAHADVQVGDDERAHPAAQPSRAQPGHRFAGGPAPALRPGRRGPRGCAWAA
jgi:hypothetical protein